MDTFFLILLPLVISSLGFLSYRHPSIARQILKPLQYITIAFFILFTIYNITQSSAYYKAMDGSRIDIYKRQDKDLYIDSLYKTVKSKDSIDLIILYSRYQRDKSYEIDKYLTIQKDSTQKNIQLLIQNSQDTYKTYSLYCLVVFLIIVTLFGLTFLFDNVHNKEKVSDINNPNDQTE